MLCRRFGLCFYRASTSGVGGLIRNAPKQRLTAMRHAGGDDPQRTLPADCHPAKPVVVNPQNPDIPQFSRRALGRRARQRREDRRSETGTAKAAAHSQ
jgi:hypothetical protein